MQSSHYRNGGNIVYLHSDNTDIVIGLTAITRMASISYHVEKNVVVGTLCCSCTCGYSYNL